jgi:hypothetical protein
MRLTYINDKWHGNFSKNINFFKSIKFFSLGLKPFIYIEILKNFVLELDKINGLLLITAKHKKTLELNSQINKNRIR